MLDAVLQRIGRANGSSASGDGVTVVVLDSFPSGGASSARPATGVDDPFQQIRRCLERLERGYTGGAAAVRALPAASDPFWRLRQAAAGGIASNVLDFTGLLPRGVLSCPHHAYFDGIPSVADHGLFVADIIKDIAPGANVVVYRVFSDDGVSDLHTIAQAAQHAIDAARGGRLILSLSGGFGPQAAAVVHLLEGLKDGTIDPQQLFEEIRTTPPSPPQREIRDLLRSGLLERDHDGYHFRNELAPLDKVFSQTGEGTKVLAIAATGNDSYHHPGPIPFGPRLPAAIENVLGVSAFVPDRAAGPGRWRAASYSNDNDFFRGNDGIGAFGGETRADGASDVHLSPLGLFVSDTYPDGSDNLTGWAHWSGTSFACPVVSGFAAALWSAKPDLNAGELRRSIYGPSNANDPEYLPFRQTPV